MPVIRLQVTQGSGGGQGQATPAIHVSLPEALRKVGPVISASVRVPENVTAPGACEPVFGTAQIDTGAEGTNVDIDVAEAAGLPIRGIGMMRSASHAQILTPLFAGIVQLPGLNLNATRMMGAKLAPQGLIALIGRDLLRHCIFIYDGPEGTYKLIW